MVTRLYTGLNLLPVSQATGEFSLSFALFTSCFDRLYSTLVVKGQIILLLYSFAYRRNYACMVSQFSQELGLTSISLSGKALVPSKRDG